MCLLESTRVSLNQLFSLLWLTRFCRSDEIIKAAEKKAMGAGPASTGAGPASSSPAATASAVSRPVASTLQAPAARANPVRSSPSLPQSQPVRSGIPQPGHGSRPASAEPSTRNAYPSGPRMPTGSPMGSRQRPNGPQAIQTDPRYQQQRAGYGPPPPNSAGPGIPQYNDPRRAGPSPQPQHQRPQQPYGSPGAQQPYSTSSLPNQHQQQQQRMMHRPQQAPPPQRGRF
jgi:hypothetical protein